MDERVRLDHSYGIQKVPGSPGLALHGFPDDRPRNCAWYHVRNGTIAAGLTVVSFALTDVSADDGGFVCGPGNRRALFYKYAPGQWAWLSHQWTAEELAALTARQRALVAPPCVFYADTRKNEHRCHSPSSGPADA